MVDFAGTDLPKNLMRRYDTTRLRHAGHRLRCRPRRATTPASSSTPRATSNSSPTSRTISTWSRSRRQRKAARRPRSRRRQYKGERLTLNFQDIETRAVLQLLADASGQNIVVSDTVSGSVTLRLQNVPWDQALDIVLRTKGLDKRQDGNVIIVAPAEELAAREKAELAAKQGHPGTRAAALGVSAGQLRQGRRHRRAASRVDGTSSLLVARAATCRSTTAPTRCCCRIPPIGSRTCAAWSRRSTFRSGRCRSRRASSSSTTISSASWVRCWASTASTRTAPMASSRPPVRPRASTPIVSSALTNLTTTGSTFPVRCPTGTAAPNRYNVNLPVSSPAGSIALGMLGSDYLRGPGAVGGADREPRRQSSPRRA